MQNKDSVRQRKFNLFISEILSIEHLLDSHHSKQSALIRPRENMTFIGNLKNYNFDHRKKDLIEIKTPQDPIDCLYQIIKSYQGVYSNDSPCLS